MEERLDFDMEELIRAYIPVFCVRTIEIDRCTRELARIADELGMSFSVYNPGGGLKNAGKKWVPMDPVQALDEIIRSFDTAPLTGERSLWVLQLFHLFLMDPDPVIIAKLRTLHEQTGYNATLVLLVEPSFSLPTELRDFMLVNYSLPGPEALQELVESDLDTYSVEEKREIVASLKGFSQKEAENILSITLTRKGRLVPKLVKAFREQVIRDRSGRFLEFIRPRERIEDVGGMKSLTNWLNVRKAAFLHPEALRKYGLTRPRGIILFGVPGCGKTLVARSIAGSWSMPLLKMNVGCLYKADMGASERRMTQAVDIARAMAPCVLLIDEIEKAFPRVSSYSDGGVALRVQAILLEFLQESSDGIFVVATSNGIGGLPPELLRRGRWDEIFFVDIPDGDERRQILDVLFRRYNISEEVDSNTVRATEGFSGAELEQVVRDTLYTECIHAKRPFSAFALLRQIRTQVPLSRLMQPEITALRKWAAARARSANQCETDGRISAGAMHEAP